MTGLLTGHCHLKGHLLKLELVNSHPAGIQNSLTHSL
jgi:hypothetical protein